MKKPRVAYEYFVEILRVCKKLQIYIVMPRASHLMMNRSLCRWRLCRFVLLSHVLITVKVTVDINSPSITVYDQRKWRAGFGVNQLIGVGHIFVRYL